MSFYRTKNTKDSKTDLSPFSEGDYSMNNHKNDAPFKSPTSVRSGNADISNISWSHKHASKSKTYHYQYVAYEKKAKEK